jgi:hypothetical protein
MRYLLTLTALGVCLAGCGTSSSSTSPHPTPSPTPHTLARVQKVPQTTPPPVKTKKGHQVVPANPRSQPKALPTLQSVTFATPTPIPASDYTDVIQGTVTDSKTHTPLAGALITVGTGNHVTRTDAFGKYRISFPAQVSVPVQVKMNGYASDLAEGRLGPHKTLTLNFKLSSIKPGHPAAPTAPQVFGNP